MYNYIWADNRVICQVLSIFRVAAAMLWEHIVQCKRDNIIRVLPCLLTDVLGSTTYAVDSINQLYKTSRNDNGLYTHSMGRNEITIDMVELMTV